MRGKTRRSPRRYTQQYKRQLSFDSILKNPINSFTTIFFKSSLAPKCYLEIVFTDFWLIWDTIPLSMLTVPQFDGLQTVQISFFTDHRLFPYYKKYFNLPISYLKFDIASLCHFVAIPTHQCISVAKTILQTCLIRFSPFSVRSSHDRLSQLSQVCLCI